MLSVDPAVSRCCQVKCNRSSIAIIIEQRLRNILARNSPINPRPDGAFPDPVRRWGGERLAPPPPLLSAKLLGRFSIRKRHLIAPGLNFPNMLQILYVASLMTVTGRAKGKILDFLSLLAAPGKVSVSK